MTYQYWAAGLIALLSSITCASAIPHSDASIPADINQLQAPISADAVDFTEQVARQMAPLVVISPKEKSQCCFPSDALLHWRNKVVLVSKNPVRTFEPVANQWSVAKQCEFLGLGPLSDTVSLNAADAYYITTCQKKSALYQKEFAQVPCWTELWYEEPYLQVKYWFWYPFNDHPNDTNLNLFDHEGDWEHIELRAKILDKKSFRYFYYFDRHGRSHSVLPSQWESSIDGIKQHPIIWAAEGSHVPYERSDIHEKIEVQKGVPGLTTMFDNVADSDIRWKTFDSLNFKHKEPQNPVWTFKGQWGDDSLTPSIPFTSKKLTDAPTGPATRDRYANSAGMEVFP